MGKARRFKKAWGHALARDFLKQGPAPRLPNKPLFYYKHYDPVLGYEIDNSIDKDPIHISASLLYVHTAKLEVQKQVSNLEIKHQWKDTKQKL